MALFDLNRSNDTPIPTLKLAEIVPKVWPTRPNVQPGQPPAYLGNVTYDWPYNGIGPSAPGGNQPGADVNLFTANATGPYEPKNQGNKSNMLGAENKLAVEITTPRGWIDPLEPYGAPPTPTLAVLIPDSRVVAPTDDLSLQLVGSNFMPSSQIYIAGQPERTTFISPGELRTLIRGSVFDGPGLLPVYVSNAGVNSGSLDFEITAAP